MAPPEVFARMDPRAVYDLSPQMWDFVLLTLLLFYILRGGIETGRQIGRHNLFHFAQGLLSHREHKKMDNAISFILALIMSIGLVRYSNVSLQMLFTTGIFPGIMSLLLAFMAYGAIRRRVSDDNKWYAIGGAIFVWGLVYSFLSLRGEVSNWFAPVLWFILISSVVSIMAGRKVPGVETPAPLLRSTQADVGTAISSAGSLSSQLTNAATEVSAADKEGASVIQQLKNSLASLTSRFEQLQKTQAFQSLVAAAFAIAISLWPNTAVADIRKELRQKNYSVEVINAAVAQLPKAPGTPPGEASTIPPPSTPEQARIGPQQEAKFETKLSYDAQQIEIAVQSLMKEAERFQNVSQLLERVPKDHPKLLAANKKLLEDLGKLKKSADALVQRTRKPDAQPLLDDADQLQAEVNRLLLTATASNENFEKELEPMMAMLKSDGAEFKNVSSQLRSVSDNINRANDVVRKRIATIKLDGVSYADIQQYEQAYANLQKNVSAAVHFMETHGSNEHFLKNCSVFVDTLQRISVFLDSVRPELATLQERWNFIDAKIKQLEHQQKKETIARSESAGVIDLLDKLTKTVQDLETTFRVPPKELIKLDLQGLIQRAQTQASTITAQIAELYESRAVIAGKDLYSMLIQQGQLAKSLDRLRNNIMKLQAANNQMQIPMEVDIFIKEAWPARLIAAKERLEKAVLSPPRARAA